MPGGSAIPGRTSPVFYHKNAAPLRKKELHFFYLHRNFIPTGITQNVKDLLSSREVENIFENSDFVYMLNQAQGDREILAKQLNISQQQMTYVTHSDAGEGLIFYGNVILPFIDRFPQDTELYRVMTTKLLEISNKSCLLDELRYSKSYRPPLRI